MGAGITLRSDAPLQELDPVLVMVASGDDDLRARVRALVRFMEDVTVVDVDSGEHAVLVVEGLYESPRGCPDVLVLDPAMTDARWAADRVSVRCPGVRIVHVVGATTTDEQRILAAIDDALVTIG